MGLLEEVFLPPLKERTRAWKSYVFGGQLPESLRCGNGYIGYIGRVRELFLKKTPFQALGAWGREIYFERQQPSRLVSTRKPRD